MGAKVGGGGGWGFGGEGRGDALPLKAPAWSEGYRGILYINDETSKRKTTTRTNPQNAKAKKIDIPEELKPKQRERVKFPALQRKTSTTSSALFGHTVIGPNSPEVKEFRFNKTRRGSKAGLDAAMDEVSLGSAMSSSKT